MIVFFGFVLIGLSVIGAIGWVATLNENIIWTGRLIGLIGGGLLGHLFMRKWLNQGIYGEYCQCTDGA